MLFFDDEPLYSRKAIDRHLGKPRRVSAYHEAAGNCTWGRPAVFRTNAGWRMVYQAGVGRPNSGGGIMLLAESPDGLNWAPCHTTGLLDLSGRVAPHQILPADTGSYCSVVEDPLAAPRQRYRLLAVRENRDSSVWASPDLLNWTPIQGARWHPHPPDPPAFAFWNALKGCHTITARPEWPDRRLCLIDTYDWQKFSTPVLALNADADDRPLAQHYGMYVLPYYGHYVGLLWIFYAGEATPHLAPHRYRGGKLETYLTYSVNGIHWQRCTHAPLFRNGEHGAPDAGCLQVASVVSLDDGTLRAYAACSANEHGICPPEDGHIVAYELRPDGFVCLEAGSATGVLSTRALYWRGGEARMNIEASDGEVRVRVLEARGKPITGFAFEDCVPFNGDKTDWTPQWRNDRRLVDLTGQMIRLEVEMTRARLYALRGDFVLCRLRDLQRWEKEHLIPERRPGF